MKRIIIILGMIHCLSCQVFAQDDWFLEVKKKAEHGLEPLVAEKETELKEKGFTQIEMEYQLDCYKIDMLEELIVDINASTMSMILSMIDSYTSYDKLLNKYYNLYRKTLDEESKKALLKEQRAWLDVRDAYAEFATCHREHLTTVMGGGTMYYLFPSQMMLEFLKKRVDELFKYYKDQDY